MSLDNPRSQIQTQAGALSDLFGGEERFENLFLQITGNPPAGVGDFDSI